MLQLESVTNALELKCKIVKAAYAYSASSRYTITNLARYFGVSENKMTEWFFEAISKGYIESDKTCNIIIKKHIAEYESQHGLFDSSLRTKYEEALGTRNSTRQKFILS